MDASVFDDFDYVALGHIHSLRQWEESRCVIAVRLLNTPFTEAGQEKSITVVELKEKGNTQITFISLHPMRGYAQDPGKLYGSNGKIFL